MRIKKSCHFADPRLSASRASVAAIIAASLAVTPAQGAFDLWNIREVYTYSSGTKQFIEFFTASSSQQFVGGQQISVTDGSTTHTFTVPSNLPGDTASHAFLIGTASIASSGSPTPDYIIPDNFFFAGGGTISFWGQNPAPTYTALPTDGVNSRTWSDGNAVNSPQNFAGQSGTIVIPNSPPSISITNPPDNS